jgi:hypothetical protein
VQLKGCSGLGLLALCCCKSLPENDNPIFPTVHSLSNCMPSNLETQLLLLHCTCEPPHMNSVTQTCPPPPRAGSHTYLLVQLSMTGPSLVPSAVSEGAPSLPHCVRMMDAL